MPNIDFTAQQQARIVAAKNRVNTMWGRSYTNAQFLKWCVKRMTAMVLRPVAWQKEESGMVIDISETEAGLEADLGGSDNPD